MTTNTTTTTTAATTTAMTEIQHRLSGIDPKQRDEMRKCKNPMRSELGKYLIGMGYVACARYVEAIAAGKATDAMRRDAAQMLKICAEEVARIPAEPLSIERMLIKLPTEPGQHGVIKMSGMGAFKAWLQSFKPTCDFAVKKPIPAIGDVPQPKLPAPGKATKTTFNFKTATQEEREAYVAKCNAALMAKIERNNAMLQGKF